MEPDDEPTGADDLRVCEPGSTVLEERWVSTVPERGADSIAIAAGRVAVSTGDGTVGLWSLGPDAATFDGVVGAGGTAYGTCQLAFDGDAGRLVVASITGVDFWDVDRGLVLGSFRLDFDYAVAVAVSNDGQWVAIGDASQGVHLWQPDSGAIVERTAPGPIEDLAFVPTTGDLVVACPGVASWVPVPNVELWKAGTWERSAAWDVLGARAIAVSGDGRMLAGVTQGAVVRIDLGSSLAAPAFASAAFLQPEAVAFSADASEIAVVGAEGTVRVLSAATMEETARRDVALQIGAEFDEAGGIVTVGRDGVIRLLGCE